MENNNLTRRSHRPFSPDLPPSDFFWFGHTKVMSQGTEFMEKPDLLAELREILNGMSGVVLKGVFAEWEKQLQICFYAGYKYRE
jgi:hypothetical protein